MERSKVTLERTLEEVSRIAFADNTQALTFGPDWVKFKDSSTLPPNVSAAIASVTSTETKNEYGTKVSFGLKLHNKMAALTLLAQYFGITNDFNQARETLKLRLGGMWSH